MKSAGYNKSEKVATVAFILIVIFIVFSIVSNIYQIGQHESLTFKIKTTYEKDGYSYTDETGECIMYDPDTTNDIDVIKRFQDAHAIEKKENVKQEVKVTSNCMWFWMPKSEEIYR